MARQLSATPEPAQAPNNAQPAGHGASAIRQRGPSALAARVSAGRVRIIAAPNSSARLAATLTAKAIHSLAPSREKPMLSRITQPGEDEEVVNSCGVTP